MFKPIHHLLPSKKPIYKINNQTINNRLNKNRLNNQSLPLNKPQILNNNRHPNLLVVRNNLKWLCSNWRNSNSKPKDGYLLTKIYSKYSSSLSYLLSPLLSPSPKSTNVLIRKENSNNCSKSTIKNGSSVSRK